MSWTLHVVVVFTAVVVVSAIALVVEISCVTMGTSKTIKCDIFVLVPTSLKLISISSSIFGLTTNSLPVGAEKKLLSVRWFWFYCCDAVFCFFFGAESVPGFFFVHCCLSAWTFQQFITLIIICVRFSLLCFSAIHITMIAIGTKCQWHLTALVFNNWCHWVRSMLYFVQIFYRQCRITKFRGITYRARSVQILKFINFVFDHIP